MVKYKCEPPPALDQGLEAPSITDPHGPGQGPILLDQLLSKLVAQRKETRADVLVGEGLELCLQLVRFVDERLDPLQLTVVRIDEPGKETKH